MVPAAEVDGDERGPGLDEPAGEQGGLPPVVPTVEITQARLALRGRLGEPGTWTINDQP